MKRLSIFFVFLLCAVNFSLFANDVNPHVLFIQDRGKYTGIALSLDTVTDNPDNGILISHGAGINGINPNFIWRYAFNPAHRLTLKLPYYLLYNDKDDANNIVDIDLTYTYTKKFNSLNILFGPHIKGTVYHSSESPSTSNYLYNTGRNTLGAALRLMDHYDLATEGRYAGWDAAIKYDISLPSAGTIWRPGVIEVYGDVLFGNTVSARTKSGISLGLGEYIALPYSGTGEKKAGVYAITSIRLGTVFMFGRNVYLESSASFWPDPVFDSPVAWFGNLKGLFGYKF